MKLLALLSTLAALALAAVSLGAAPAAAATTVPEATSQNWAGYVAGANGTAFTRVSGSWVQPSANASAGDGYSAFWVGLGGDSQSQSLEQIGTQADVSGGQTIYYAWYELVPSAPVKLSLQINPGDHISASVSVSGSNVTVSLTDQATGASFNKTLQMSNPDTSSAEWIAEAPSAVYGDGTTQTLPLADFGSVKFTSATATAGGQTGSISSWTSQAVQLSGSGGGAQPTSPASDGLSFSVGWEGSSATATDTGYGYGGGGYGGYGYGGYGYYAPPGYAYGY
jgi:hypothetical protein